MWFMDDPNFKRRGLKAITLEVMDSIFQRLTSCQYEQIVHLSILHTEVTLTNLWELKQYR